MPTHREIHKLTLNFDTWLSFPLGLPQSTAKSQHFALEEIMAGQNWSGKRREKGTEGELSYSK